MALITDKYHYTVFIGTLVCQLWVISCSGLSNSRTNLHYIPSTVNPGHIITILDHEEPDTRSRIHSTSLENHAKDYFTLLKNHVLVTSKNISSLQGSTLSISIQNESPTRHWKDIYHIKIGTSVPKVHFVDNPYFGVITENQRIGTAVMGLKSLAKSIKQFPKGCKLSLPQGDVEYFQLSVNKTNHRFIDLISRSVLDRELRASYYVVIMVSCPEEEEKAYAQIHVGVADENDNAPEFGLELYSVAIDLEDAVYDKRILQVEALDADYGNDITYSISGTSIFSIHPKLGKISIANPNALQAGESYEFKVFAFDQEHHQSQPATVRISLRDAQLQQVLPWQMQDEQQDSNNELTVLRSKRALRDDRVFVVRDDQMDELFSVAAIPNVEEERYNFVDPIPENLDLDAETGMVTRLAGHVWNGTMDMLYVNITRTDDPSYQDDLIAIVHVITRTSWEEPIFNNEPSPLYARVPVWVRPDTIIFTLQSSIDADFDAQVEFTIESGADGRFVIDRTTGEVKISDIRADFIPGDVYELAISAQSVGSAIRFDTPSQVLYVKVDDIDPQPYEDPFVFNMPETTPSGDSIGSFRAKSFQDLPLSFSMAFDDPQDANLFTINSNTGDITTNQGFEYIRTEDYQFTGQLTITEDISNLAATVKVFINLVPENLHTPYFPASHYLAVDISEDVAIGTPILQVIGVDLDPGDLGLMDFTVNHPLFNITTTDNKVGELITIGDLDYDFIGPEHMYEFTIVATDKDPVNPRSGTATVQVWMTNVSDEPPVFFPAPEDQAISLTENTDESVGHIAFIQAHDPDDDTISFRFVDCVGGTDTTCGIFDIDVISGQVKLNAPVPPATENLDLVVEVTDDGDCCGSPGGGGPPTRGVIPVNFIGVNHPPSFPECSSYLNAFSIAENQPPNTPVGNLTAIDDDVGTAGIVSFSIVEDFPYPFYFAVTSVEGSYVTELYSLETFNREAPFPGSVKVDGKYKYKVTVQVTDQGNPVLSSTCFLFVSIDDENDNDPKFDDSSYQITILYSTLNDYEFMRIFAIDDDEGANAVVTYAISEQANVCGGQGCLAIDPNSGWVVKIGDPPNTVTEIDFTVTATDGGQPSLEREVQCVVRFTDNRNELPPAWELIDGIRIDDIEIEIDENILTGYILDVFLKATVLGTTGEVSYYLPTGRTIQENRDNHFREQPNNTAASVNVYVAQNLDYSESDYFILKLRASKKGETSGNYADSRLVVNLRDVNDKIPEFQAENNQGNIEAPVTEDETEVGDLVISVIAIDLDGEAPNNVVTYGFSDSCQAGDCQAFTIDSNTGGIFAAQTFDRNVQSEFILVVYAIDGADSAIPGVNGPNQVEIDLTVPVLGPSKGSPFFPAPTRVSILEGQEMYHSVANVTALIPDPEFSVAQYSISYIGNQKRNYAVTPQTGEIFITGDILYAEETMYNLTYNVFDGRSLRSTSLIFDIISTNLFPAFFDQPIYTSSNDRTEHDENGIPVNLLSVRAEDPDSGRSNHTVTYALEGPLVENNFIMSEDDVMLINGNIDRDYPNGYSVWQMNIVASDEPDETVNKGYAVLNVLLVDINDNTPIFQMCCVDGYVAENSGTGTSVLQLLAIDADAGDNAVVEYEALMIPTDESQNPIFTLSPNGLIETTTSPLDRETQDYYEMIVRARDGGGRYSNENQTIRIHINDENDHSPSLEFTQLVFDMPEEMPVGSIVGALQGLDADIGDNAKLTFEISGDTGNNFYMDDIFVSKNGVIKILNIVDYESLPDNDKTLNFQVAVSDPERTGNSASVTINVLDVNDNAPVFTPSQINVTLPEDVSVGEFVATFTAVDADIGENAVFEYSIDYENTDPEKKFVIDPATGEVTTRNTVDREEQADYEVHILAIDEGQPPMTGTATLSVTLSDINDNAPDFPLNLLYPPNEPIIVVGADTQQNDVVVRFTAIDLDLPENGPPFTMVPICDDASTNGCRDFTFAATGDVEGELRAALNGYNRTVQNRKYYDLEIRMTDNPTSGQGSQTAIRTLRIYIESGNDHRMEEDGSEKDVVVNNYMGMFDNVPCGVVFVNDRDDWDKADKTYECIGGCTEIEGENLWEYFYVDAASGEVFMLAGAPQRLHTLSVAVTDRKWDQTITATVRVRVVYTQQDAVMSAGSLRLEATTGQALILRTVEAPVSKLELFRESLAEILNTPKENVDILTVLDVPPGPDGLPSNMVDIQVSAHGSPPYPASKINGKIQGNIVKLQTDAGIVIGLSPVDLCATETCFSGGCTNVVLTKTEPALVNTNTTSFVGINTTYSVECGCPSQNFDTAPPVCDAYSCLNNGTCTNLWNGFECTCFVGYDGPRCQNLKASFDGSSWAWFDSLGAAGQCGDFRLSFEFITTAANGLILYNGPMSDADMGPDFISCELEGAKPRVRLNLGDGEADITVNSPDLNDGMWHTLEIVVDGEFRTVRLIVDHCESSIVDESINGTSEIRTSCESSHTYINGDQFLLNVNTPLEVGGKSTSYPGGITTTGFNGCLKNLRYNDKLYDLELSQVEKSGSPSNVCEREQGCASTAADPCPVNSFCSGSFGSADQTCECHFGKMGPDCIDDTPVLDFAGDNSYIEWELKPAFNQTVMDPKACKACLQFRTRTNNGVLFKAASFSTLELIKLEVIDTILTASYDAGAGINQLSLHYVNVSDGISHETCIKRYGNQFILEMDSSEGKYYNESMSRPNEHQLIYLANGPQETTSSGAQLMYKKYHTEPDVSDVLVASCVSDIRIDGVYLPVKDGETSEAATVVQKPGTLDSCISNECDNWVCPVGQNCTERYWRLAVCICPPGFYVDGDACVVILDCSIPRCSFGTCVFVKERWKCNCDPGYQGETCAELIPVISTPNVSLSTGAIVAIVLCLLVLLLLILVIIFLVQRNKQDPLLIDPDDDIRENIVYYDEEGAGEEDMHAYDLSRLQKPVNPDDGMNPDHDHVRPAGITNLAYQPEPLLAPEPMHQGRAPFLPGERPDVGDFIGDRLGDADNDANAPPYDSVREYEYEGGGSSAGSLSSLQSSSSGDLDFDYLNNYGPRFQKLADMYGAGQEDEGD